jgi:hypothetical protein
MLRFIYTSLGIDYIGKIEQKVIDRQKHQKFLCMEQIKISNYKLKHQHPKQYKPMVPLAKPVNIKNKKNKNKKNIIYK